MTLRYYPCPVRCQGCDQENKYPHRILEALEFTFPKERRIVDVFGDKYWPFLNSYCVYLGDLDAMVIAINGQMKAHGPDNALREIGNLVQKYCTLKGYKTEENPPLRIIGQVTIIQSGPLD